VYACSPGAQVWSPDGHFEASSTWYACGGADGSVSQVIRLWAADDPEGRLRQTVVSGTQSSGLSIAWVGPHHRQVTYAQPLHQPGVSEWRGVQITYEPLPPCTVKRPDATYTPCILDQTP